MMPGQSRELSSQNYYPAGTTTYRYVSMSAGAGFGSAPYPSQLAKSPKGEPGELATEELIFAVAQEELSFAVAKGY